MRTSIMVTVSVKSPKKKYRYCLCAHFTGNIFTYSTAKLVTLIITHFSWILRINKQSSKREKGGKSS